MLAQRTDRDKHVSRCASFQAMGDLVLDTPFFFLPRVCRVAWSVFIIENQMKPFVSKKKAPSSLGTSRWGFVVKTACFEQPTHCLSRALPFARNGTSLQNNNLFSHSWLFFVIQHQTMGFRCIPGHNPYSYLYMYSKHLCSTQVSLLKTQKNNDPHSVTEDGCASFVVDIVIFGINVSNQPLLCWTTTPLSPLY